MPAWLKRSGSRWFPEYILFKLDEFGIPILPPHHVTSMLERRHVWLEHIRIDCVTRTIVLGKLSYPRTCWRITQSYLELGGGRSEDEALPEDGSLLLPVRRGGHPARPPAPHFSLA